MSERGDDWWTFHGDPQRTGYTDRSDICASNVSKLRTQNTLQLGGPVLSVPAIHDGFIYVGTANGTRDLDGNPNANGGGLHKIRLSTGETVATYFWPTADCEGDIHGFTGMGCTPAVVDGRVYFSAFNGLIYCLDAEDLSEAWITDLRHTDLAQNQPTSVAPLVCADANPEGWCSPLVVEGRVYVGIGEGENSALYAYVHCLDAKTGVVQWIFCTSKFREYEDNRPNELPKEVIEGELPAGFTTFDGTPFVKGCSVWSAITYDEKLKRIFCATGNPPAEVDKGLPALGYAYGVLSLDAMTGKLMGFVQIPVESSYRNSDIDVDFGSSAALFERDGKRVLGIGCKNGGFFVIDPETMKILDWRQLLPYYNDGKQIPTVDPHPCDPPDDGSDPNPVVSNKVSNQVLSENFHGTYSTPAIDPVSKRIFIGTGGNNYHHYASGIDHETTPFLRALDWETLKDAWEMDDSDPRKYVIPSPPMYETPGEAGLSSPAVVNDVVFCSTSKVAIYAFDTKTGKMLWSDRLGEQTGGMSGGYGYCLGMAVSGNYVVAGGLVFGRDGGILRIYTLES